MNCFRLKKGMCVCFEGGKNEEFTAKSEAADQGTMLYKKKHRGAHNKNLHTEIPVYILYFDNINNRETKAEGKQTADNGEEGPV